MNPLSGLNRRRRGIIAAAAVVLMVGLASRSSSIPFPTFLASYAGDTLWAALVFLLLAFLKPSGNVQWQAALTLTIAFGVELLQLYQAPWLNAIRDTLPGRLVLGRSGGFRFSDLICYTVGTGSAALIYQWAVDKTFKNWPIILGIGFTIFITIAVIACNVGQGGELFAMANKVPGRDKTGHFILMGLLTFFLVLMLVPRMKSPPLKGTIIVTGISSLVITLEEGSQYFISSRSFSLADLACSLAGAVLFAALALVFLKKTNNNQP